MRTIAALVAATAFVAHATVADAKGPESIPQSLRGSWAPSAEGCKRANGPIIVLSAGTYTRSEANCRVVGVDETRAVPGSLYSVHLQCSKPDHEAQETLSDVLLLPKNVNQILIGADFSHFKDYQRCPAK
jgi:hypothetical protein